jgi:hypothetical protein
MVIKRRACGTGISVAPVTTRSSCSINSAIWSDARFVPETSTAPMAGKTSSSRSLRGTKEPSKLSPFEVMLPSLSRICMSSWNPKGLSTRFAFPQIRFSKRESVICSSDRSGGPRTTCSDSTRAFTTRRRVGPVRDGCRQSGVAPRRVVSACWLHYYELALLGEEYRGVLQQARHRRVYSQLLIPRIIRKNGELLPHV